MKMRRQFMLFMLALALALVPGAALAEGSYTESVLSLPEGYAYLSALAQAPDGAAAAAAKRADGSGWDLLTWRDLGAEPDALPLAYEGGDITHISIAPDGRLVAALDSMSAMIGALQKGEATQAEAPHTNEAQNGGEPEVTQAEGGTAMQMRGAQSAGAEPKTVLLTPDDLKTTLVWFDEQGHAAGQLEVSGMASQIAALDGGRVAVLSMSSGVSAYDDKGKTVWQIQDREITGIAVSGGTLAAATTDKFVLHDAATGQKQGSVDISLASGARIAATQDGSVYVMDTSGLHAVNVQDGTSSLQMESIGTYFGDPGNAISGLAVMPDGSVAALIAEGGGNYMGGRGVNLRVGERSDTLLTVYRQSDASGDKTPFKVSALRASSKLRKAVSDFQRLHPELLVSLDTRMSEDDESPVDDHIRTLNTDLLAGKGGDVLILDGLPADKYVQKGILEDVSDLAEGAGLLPGILAGSKTADGKLYGIPTQFSFETLWGKQDVVDSIRSLPALLDLPLLDGQTALNPRKPEDWLRLLYPASESGFVDETGALRFDAPAFEDFLETLYQLYIAQGDDPADNADLLTGRLSAEEIIAMRNGAVALYPTSIAGLMQLNLAYTISGAQQGGVAAVPSMEGEGHVYTPSLIAGINTQSANRELSAEFIRYLLSDEIQQIDQADGLPVVASSLDKLFNDALERSRDGNYKMMMAFGDSNPLEVISPDEEAWRKLRAMCDTLDTPAVIDETLMGFIVDETEAFFDGAVGAQDAALAVQQRAWSYLNE